MKVAQKSPAGFFNCQYDWSVNCYVQCGGSKNKYFFEAYPKNPDTFIRGDAESIEIAERIAWEQHQKHLSCHLDHSNPENFDKKQYRNGLGFCINCNLSQRIFLPSEICIICNANTYYTQDVDHNWYCENCKDKIPENKLTTFQKYIRSPEYKQEIETPISQEDFEKSLTDVFNRILSKQDN